MQLTLVNPINTNPNDLERDSNGNDCLDSLMIKTIDLGLSDSQKAMLAAIKAGK